MALLLLGGRGTDIGRLRPVEGIKLYEKSGLLFLEVDTGDVGWGLTVDQAVRKLKETAPGEIYLDTAGYLVLEEELEECLPDLGEYLKRRTRVVYGPEDVDLGELVVYLKAHRPSGIIGDGRNAVERVSLEGGKITLKKV